MALIAQPRSPALPWELIQQSTPKTYTVSTTRETAEQLFQMKISNENSISPLCSISTGHQGFTT